LLALLPMLQRAIEAGSSPASWAMVGAGNDPRPASKRLAGAVKSVDRLAAPSLGAMAHNPSAVRCHHLADLEVGKAPAL
jgi:hypothetical protein